MSFAVNDLTGGVNGTIAGHVDTEHEIVMNSDIYTVNSFHGQSIETIGKDMEVVARDLDGNIEAIKHNTLPIYGVVWHPERMKNLVLPNEIKTLLL